jgi:serine/threonine-protein kinase
VLAGRFRIGALLGSGGVGAVYEAFDETERRPVALKLLHASLAADATLLARLGHEAEALNRLAHENIVRAWGLFEDQRRRFLVMERLVGTTLAARLAEGPLPTAEALAILDSILRGLEAAHAHGLVHRDLKPSNLFLTGTGVVKLLDFGVVKFVAEGASRHLTRTGMVVGSAEYMSPEQASGEPIDARTDVYAVGCVAYAMLAGRPPFSDAPALEIMTHHVSTPVPSLETVRPGLRGAAQLNRFVLRALQKTPDMRFQSAEQMRAALGRLRAELDGAAPTAAATAPQVKVTAPSSPARGTAPTQPARPPLKVPSQPGGVSAAGMILSVLIGLAIAGAIAWFWLYR